MTKDITVYTTNQCAYCHMVKKWLDAKGHSYNEVNVEQDPSRQQEMVSMTGQMNVPVTVVTKIDGTKDVTVGYNLGKLSSAIAN